MVVGTAVKSQAQQRQLRRWGRKLPRGNDFYFEMQLQQREEQQRRDGLKRAHEGVARALGVPEHQREKQ